jgi:inorganic pyrophosphatase
MNFKYIPSGSEAPNVCNAIVEIPQGSRTKYEYNLEYGIFQLDRVLYSSIHYPAAYGFIPSTLYDDGDPVDVLIIIDQPLHPGIMLEVRPIGILRMRDEKGLDDKIVAVAVRDPTYSPVMDIRQLQPHVLVEIEHFFATYKELEGKASISFGWANAAAAKRAISKSMRSFELSQKKSDECS